MARTVRAIVVGVLSVAAVWMGGAIVAPVGSAGDTPMEVDVPRDAAGWARLALEDIRRATVTGDPAFYREADRAVERAVALGPADPDVLLAVAELAASRHDLRGALAAGRRVLRVAPWDPAAHGIVGDALVELGRYEAGFASFQRMVDLRPDTASLARISYARELVGDVAGAIRAMRAAATFAGTRAIASWTRSHLGSLHLIEGRVGAARRAFRAAARLDPSAVEPLAGLAATAAARGDLGAARRLAEEAVARNPGPADAILVGDLASLAGDDAAAREAYTVARQGFRRLQAGGVDVDLELALFEADHGDPRAALVAARSSWEDRRSVAAADALAWALHASGRDALAARSARRARSIGTREGSFLFHAGLIERALGHDETATALLRRALAADPWFSILGPSELGRALRAI